MRCVWVNCSKGKSSKSKESVWYNIIVRHIDNCDLRMMCYLMSHGNTIMFNDWWADDDDGVRWLNLDVMVDELVIIMRCLVMRILRLIFYVWFLHIMLYMWW